VLASGDKLDEAKITGFIKAFPEYEALCVKYGEAADAENINMAVAYRYKSEFDALFARYGMTMEDFAIVVNKIGVGYSAAKMKEQGIDPSAVGFDMSSLVSPEEVAVVEKHVQELDRVFHKE
jgi:hypothetical protein